MMQNVGFSLFCFTLMRIAPIFGLISGLSVAALFGMNSTETSGHKGPTIVLTFDDAVSNHATLVAPLLREYGFGATFFITEFVGEGADNFATDKRQYMTWEQIRTLDALGFEIGNHTAYHRLATEQTAEELRSDLAYIDERCAEHGIPRPVSFAYPASRVDDRSLAVVRQHGFKWARVGGNRSFRPEEDDPMLVPGYVIREDGDVELEEILAQSSDHGGIPVLIYHGVPDYNHPWVNTVPETLCRHLELLRHHNCRVIAMRDLPTGASQHP